MQFLITAWCLVWLCPTTPSTGYEPYPFSNTYLNNEILFQVVRKLAPTFHYAVCREHCHIWGSFNQFLTIRTVSFIKTCLYIMPLIFPHRGKGRGRVALHLSLLPLPTHKQILNASYPPPFLPTQPQLILSKPPSLTLSLFLPPPPHTHTHTHNSGLGTDLLTATKQTWANTTSFPRGHSSTETCNLYYRFIMYVINICVLKY